MLTSIFRNQGGKILDSMAAFFSYSTFDISVGTAIYKLCEFIDIKLGDFIKEAHYFMASFKNASIGEVARAVSVLPAKPEV